ncbi:MAG: type II toxin-antitoxin system VapC family toxin [Gammaproteobacteria bacterium]
MVIDASALLAVLLREPHGEWVVQTLERHQGPLQMSAVNLTETLIILADRRKGPLAVFEQQLYGAGITFVPTTILQAQIAAQARHSFRINLGDCFAYALAVTENLPILTLDADFRALDVPVILPPAASMS